MPTLRVYGYDEPVVRPQAYWSLRQFAWLYKHALVAGVGVGLAGALAAGFAIRSQLYQVSAADPLILGATTVLLTLAATLACWWPARKAAMVNPTVALRSE